jgi:hypothetical protein
VPRARIARHLELLGAAVAPALERRVDVVIEAGGDNAAA